MKYIKRRLTLLLCNGLILAVCGPGCSDHPDVGAKEKSAQVSGPITFVAGKGTDKVQFGETKAEVLAKLGKPTHEDANLLSYGGLGFDVWFSRKNQRVLMITAGSLESMEDAQRFKGQVNNAVKIGTSRSDIIASIGEPSSTEASIVEGAPEKSEILMYQSIGLSITLRKERAILFSTKAPSGASVPR